MCKTLMNKIHFYHSVYDDEIETICQTKHTLIKEFSVFLFLPVTTANSTGVRYQEIKK